MSRSPQNHLLKIKKPDYNFSRLHQEETKINQIIQIHEESQLFFFQKQQSFFKKVQDEKLFLENSQIKNFFRIKSKSRSRSPPQDPLSPSSYQKQKFPEKSPQKKVVLAGIKHSLEKYFINKPISFKSPPMSPQSKSLKEIPIRSPALSPKDSSPIEKSEETMKSLHFFDLEPDQSPEEWLKYCSEFEDKSPHGYSPMFKDNKYSWRPVKVLGYSNETKRYQVEFQETGIKKAVSRLALRFFCEDPFLFQKRIEKAKLLKRKADEETRFSDYVIRTNDLLLSPMDEKEKFRLLEKLAINKETMKTRPIATHLLKILMDEIEEQFILSGKKFLVLCEMENKINIEKFHTLKIELRNLRTYERKSQGCEFRNFAYKFALKKMKSSILNKNDVIYRCELMLTEHPKRYIKESLIMTEFPKHSFPMQASSLENYLKERHMKVRAALEKKWRQTLLDELKDNLIPFYNVYESDERVYLGSELERLIRKFEFLFRSNILNNVVDENVKNWLDFLEKFFSPPTYQTNLFMPLIKLKLMINIEKRKVSNNSIDKPPKDLLSIEPNFTQIVKTLISPLEMLVETTNSLCRLNKHLFPLLSLKYKPAFQMQKDSPKIVEAIAWIKEKLQDHLKFPAEILEQFKGGTFLLTKQTKEILKKLTEKTGDKTYHHSLLPKYSKLLAKYQTAKDKIQRISAYNKQEKLFDLEIDECKEKMLKKAEKVHQTVLTKLCDIFRKEIEILIGNYEGNLKKLTHIPENEHQLLDLRILIEKKEEFLKEMDQKAKYLNNIQDIFDAYFYEIPEKVLHLYYYLKTWPNEIEKMSITAIKNCQQQELKFKETLSVEKNEFLTEVSSLFEKFEAIKKYNNFKYIKEESSEVNALKEKIEKSLDHVKIINFKEKILCQSQTQYDALHSLALEFEPYNKLWDLVLDFDIDKQDWNKGPFLKLNYSSIEKKMEFFIKELIILQKIFLERKEDFPVKVTKMLKDDIEKFRGKLWLIDYLTNEAVLKKPAVWRDIFRECELTYMEPNNEMTLMSLIDHGLGGFKEKIEEITKRVEKQWNFEKKLNEIQEKVKGTKLEIIPYKSSKTYILKSYDEIGQFMDDNLNTILLMKSSPYSKAIGNKIRDLELRLILIQDTLENWIKLQRTWLYLEPIFSGEDFQDNMKEEKKKFEKVDKNWRTFMENFSHDSSLWDNIETEKLKLELEEDNKSLDQIQKSLTNYLETKRLIFSRFYFLSDEELLEILSQNKDPNNIQKHINKCFEGINQMLFSPSFQITHIISNESEEIRLLRPIETMDSEQNKIKPENWLSALEVSMQETLQHIIENSLLSSYKIDRLVWIFQWPGQVILLINLIRWTKETEALLADKIDLTNYYHSLTNQLDNVVNQVRGDLKSLQRKTLEALVVIEVHARDIIEELIYKGIHSLHDFLWQTQLKYYFLSKTNLKLKLMHFEKEYGFEYLGNSNRLVITPLNDRCYRTLMSAYHLAYGGAPEGPAGTGKTESVKDLSKALGTHCVVFNCSDSLNYRAIFKLLKGVASSGSFICFDEFNRIELEVLSVVAQQILSIQSAIREKKTNFMFEDETITLVVRCCVNITMNPGYAGRTELPDNLKSLFRPCAMMIPDYRMIGEIYLFSVGFHQARVLAQKVVTCLHLSSEQLSHQEHYDFGMRALKAILTAAGDLKRTFPLENEEALILRALFSLNLPKYTSSDIPLFVNIANDLFPNTQLPNSNHETLELSLKNVLSEHGFSSEPSFLLKCFQLYETIQTRHGLMLIGSASSGKSTVIDTLKQALNQMSQSNQDIYPVESYKINPKSISLNHLYGVFDADTKTWEDGVLPIIMRECAKSHENECKWVCFDGPVDSLWVENLNTVLDDNKKLCLTSGEIIKLNRSTSILFEVDNLKFASPATISRCGMIYFETKILGFEALFNGFLWRLQDNVLSECCEKFFKQLVHICLRFLEIYGKSGIFFNDLAVVNTCFEIMDVMLMSESGFSEEKCKNYMIFAIIWSFGASFDENSKDKFNLFLIELIKGQEINEIYNLNLDAYEPSLFIENFPILPNSKIFDFIYDREKKNWKSWTSTLSEFSISKNIDFYDLIIPNNDYLRNAYFLNLMVNNNRRFMLYGPTGTGKTLVFQNEMKKNYMGQDFSTLTIFFSGQTAAFSVQKAIETKVNYRRRRGYYGPEEGKKKALIFLDDLNLPEKDEYGAQPAMELLRQLIDCEGIYDLESKEFKHLNDVIYLGAFTTHHGTGTNLSLRFLRHFNLIYVEPYDADSLNKIYINIMEWLMMNIGPLHKSIKSLRDSLVHTTILLYTAIRTSKELLPTPTKSHYIFNLRDISKVFLGMSKGNSKNIKNEDEFLKLWIHECQRVFQDRLTNEEDQHVFQEILEKLLESNFPHKKYKKIVTKEPLLFSNYLKSGLYIEVPDFLELKRITEEILKEKNSIEDSKALNLVLFQDAMKHLLRISRVLGMNSGHLLMVGVGGSGRRSLTILASYIQNYLFIMLDSSIWLEEKGKIFARLASENRQMILFLAENMIDDDMIIDNLSTLLKNGELSAMLTLEERTLVLESLTNLPENCVNNQQKWEFFMKKVKQNLHLILSISISGAFLKKKLRLYPSFLNSMNIDWYLPWPEEALISTAETYMSEGKNSGNLFGDLANNLKLKEKILRIWVENYKDIQKLTERYQQELKGYYYLTPSAFLDCMNVFKRLLLVRGDKTNELIQKYDTGLEKLKSTEDEVYRMHKILEDLKPKLAKMTQENQEMLMNLNLKQKDADEKLKFCETEELETQMQKKESDDLRLECKKDLDRVLPLLNEAAHALGKISKDDLTKIRSYASPPRAVDVVMQAICYILEEDENVKLKPKELGSGEKVQDFWDYSKKHLLNDKLIKRILKFKEEKIRRISNQRVQKLYMIMKMPEFEKERVFNSSTAAGNLSIWIRTVIETHEALMIVDPKKSQLAQAEAKYKKTVALLKEKKKALTAILALIQELEKEYEIARKEQEDLQSQVSNCELQLSRAETLMLELLVEKEAWKKKGIQCREDSITLIGDVFLSAAIISYLGPFPAIYREETVDNWKMKLQEMAIMFTKDFSLEYTISDHLTVALFVTEQRLPNDVFSIDNALILENCEHWPLMIDPQKQANIWIKEKERDNKLFILKNSQNLNEIYFNLENCLQFGIPVLLENVTEDIDNIFQSVLQMRRFQKKKDYTKVKLQEKIIEASPDFRFYMTSNLQNPHYSPEICVNATLLNFTVTMKGLEDQMLNIIVKKEEPEKELQRLENLKEYFENKNKLRITENQILKLITESQNEILQDEKLIEALKRSKLETIQIEERLKKSEMDRENFNKIREIYKENAKRVANLFFILLDLANIEFMYQFSLDFHIVLFERAILNAGSTKKSERIQVINSGFTSLFYENISRSLLERHKLIFSFLICIKIMQHESKAINAIEVRFLMLGGTALETINKKTVEWLSERQWAVLNELCESVEIFKDFLRDFVENEKKWEALYMNGNNPPLSNKENLPNKWGNKLNGFQRLLLMRIFRPDKLIPAIQTLIIEETNKSFFEQYSLNLQQAFFDSNAFTPIIFVLSPGTDPIGDLIQLAEKMSSKQNLIFKSLGQGQAENANQTLKKAMKEGKWVLFQNCHLAPNWLLQLEKQLENMPSDVSKDFRLWLSSMPTPNFPISVLQKGIKMTFEPPKGLKNSLNRVFLSLESPTSSEDEKKAECFKKISFSLAFFHSIVNERKKYGPLGWNIPYEFTLSDFHISCSQLNVFLEESEEISWDSLSYMIAEINYGGRVTDPHDKKLIKIILEDFINPRIFEGGYKFSDSGVYHLPNKSTLASLKSYIKNLPMRDSPEVFGLNENAEITCSIIEANNLCSSILSLLPKTSGETGMNLERFVKEKCQFFLKQLPKEFDLMDAMRKFPVLYEESMNTVLHQELMRFNNLLEVIRNTLEQVIQGIEGTIIMNNELEEIVNNIYDNILPKNWIKISYPSEKPLSSWMIDFYQRMKFFGDWVKNGSPKNFWISGFYFTHSFLTGIRQNFARKKKIAIDTLFFDFKVLKEGEEASKMEDCCSIYGLFLEGARWDSLSQKEGFLAESYSKILITKMPNILLIPKVKEKEEVHQELKKEKELVYKCPLYRTGQRAGILSTTGQSTNFVMRINLKTQNQSSQKFWMKKGVALLCQTYD